MDKFKQILTNWFSQKIPVRIDRKFDIDVLESNKIISFIGVRRCGKTSMLFQIMRKLEEKGVNRKNLVYINFEDDRLYPLDGEELNSILIDYEEIIDYNNKQTIYLFLDEIQNMPNWSRWLRRIQDTREDVRLIITGSSAKLLSREIATELSGRTLSFEIFPLSFAEYLRFNNIEYSLKNVSFDDTKKARILKEFRKYVQDGGFPEIVLGGVNNDLILQSYFESIFFKDLVKRFNIKSIKMFEDFLKLLINNVGNRVSLSKLENQLKSIGHRVSKSTLSEYLDYIKEVYLIFNVPVFSYKIKDQMMYPKKIYSIDNGLSNRVSFKFSENYGDMLENIVYLELLRREKDVYYFLSKTDTECDFLLKENLEFIQVIQVTKSLDDDQTKRREVKSMMNALKELNINNGLILTENEEYELEENDIKIQVKPIWKWLLT